MSWQAHRAIEYGREVVGQSRDDLAEALTKITDDDWSYQMVAKLESGRKTFTVELLQAVANVQGLPYEWYLVDPRSKINGFRASNEAIPGYARSQPVDHQLGDCYDCVENINAHVQPEDMIPGGGPTPEWTVCDLRDEMLDVRVPVAVAR